MQTEVQTNQTKRPMTSEVHTKLMTEAARNPVFMAVAQGFAIRERTRNQITIHSLTQKMTKEGFNYKREDYIKVLYFLHGLGFGSLKLSSRGKLLALKNIETTLQSIGMAAINGKEPLKKAAKTNKFKPLANKVDIKIEKEHSKTKTGKIGMEQLNKKYDAELVVHFEDEVVTFKLIKGITTQQIGSFMARYYNTKEE